MVREYFFADRTSLFVALLADCSAVLDTATQHRESVSMLVSGGSSPELLYRQLSSVELDWKKIQVALVDERWVGADHDGSNELFIAKNLLLNRAADATFIPMKMEAETAVLGQKYCEQFYRQLPRPFDLVILGMGLDGHTASLFPHARGLDKALDVTDNTLCVAITAIATELTGELTERMSLSVYGLLQSRQLHLLILGEAKLAAYKRALVSEDVKATPISVLLRQNEVPVSVYWAP
ncbi:MAG: 6-phosphogluconolactonase [Oceanicoccus sp.]